ncbi:MAG: hypothetical protein ACRCST_12695 [Turicibacter sp.]
MKLYIVMLSLLMGVVIGGCSKSVEPIAINETFEVNTEEWIISAQLVSRQDGDQIILEEEMVATYRGPLERLKSYQSLNITFKTPFTQTWFSNDYDLTKIETQTFTHSGKVAITSIPKDIEVAVTVKLGDDIKEIPLARVISSTK